MQIQAKDLEVILEALSIAFLKTGAKKFDRLRSWLMNKKAEELLVENKE